MHESPDDKTPAAGVDGVAGTADDAAQQATLCRWFDTPRGRYVLGWEQGQYDSAVPLFKRALKIRERALGPDHPDVGPLQRLDLDLREAGNAAARAYRVALDEWKDAERERRARRGDGADPPPAGDGPDPLTFVLDEGDTRGLGGDHAARVLETLPRAAARG